MRRLASIFLGCLMVTSCHTIWTRVDNNNKNIHLGNIAFKAPVDWVIYNDHNNKYGDASISRSLNGHLDRIMMSKDGFRLDIIDVLRITTARAFPSINQRIRIGTLASELAEMYIAEQKNLTGINLFTITRNEPVTLSGQNGFLVQYHFRNSSGLYIEQMTYGFVKDTDFYIFSFRAPSLHFFDANIHDFINMLKSLSTTSQS